MRISLRVYNHEPRLCLEKGEMCVDIQSFLNALGSSGQAFSSLAQKEKEVKIDTNNFLREETAWKSLERIDKILTKFLQNGDPLLISDALVAVEAPFLPPIPRPPLMFGLAGNSPQTWRKEGVDIKNYPVGYARPWSSLSPHKGRVTLDPSVTSFRCAGELGVVIGKEAFQVPRSEAMSHVFGYTCVNDMIGNQWKVFAMTANPVEAPTFEEFLITSYYGRGTNGFAPVGPSIATKDEVGDPYNLHIYTRHNSILRDRSYTNAMVVGIENTIEYLSGFITLYPGSIIHMGAMGMDGITIQERPRLGEEEFVEIEIERVGALITYFKDEREGGVD